MLVVGEYVLKQRAIHIERLECRFHHLVRYNVITKLEYVNMPAEDARRYNGWYDEVMLTRW